MVLKKRVESLKKELNDRSELQNQLKACRKMAKDMKKAMQSLDAVKSKDLQGENKQNEAAHQDLIAPDEVEVHTHPHLRYQTPKNAHDAEILAEIHPGSGIYILKESKISIVTNCRFPNSYARGLMTNVFTMTALQTCSLKGGIQKGPHGKLSFGPRDALYPIAVKAITDAVEKQCTLQKWTYQARDVVKSLGTLLSEMRTKLSKDYL